MRQPPYNPPKVNTYRRLLQIYSCRSVSDPICGDPRPPCRSIIISTSFESQIDSDSERKGANFLLAALRSQRATRFLALIFYAPKTSLTHRSAFQHICIEREANKIKSKKGLDRELNSGPPACYVDSRGLAKQGGKTRSRYHTTRPSSR